MSKLFVGLMALGIGCLVADTQAAEFEKPVRIKADGKVIDTGKQWGHSGPTMEDVTGDGLPDLVLGDFSGKFQLYKNTGKSGAPEFKHAGFLQAGGEPAKVHIYCCVGSQARFVDLNADGKRDFVSNSYDPGHCYLFQRTTGSEFAPAEEIVDQKGVPVRKRPVQQQNFESFGSFYAPVDWDGDGDFDLLIGCFEGELKVRLNEGTAEKASFATENIDVLIDDEPLKVKAHLCPTVADWDGDGRWDLVAGSDDGSVTWFRNVGTRQQPKFSEGEVLVEKNETNGYNLLRWEEKDIVPGIRTQVDVVDFNGDGKLDLLVGDFCTAYKPRPDLTDEEKQRFQSIIDDATSKGKEYADAMQALRDDFAKRYPGDKIYSDEATKAWQKEYQALKESDLYKQVEARESQLVADLRPFLAETRGDGSRSFDLALSHGYVWLFVQK